LDRIGAIGIYVTPQIFLRTLNVKYANRERKGVAKVTREFGQIGKAVNRHLTIPMMVLGDAPPETHWDIIMKDKRANASPVSQYYMRCKYGSIIQEYRK